VYKKQKNQKLIAKKATNWAVQTKRVCPNSKSNLNNVIKTLVKE
jgi:hypothetical protein